MDANKKRKLALEELDDDRALKVLLDNLRTAFTINLKDAFHPPTS